MIDLSRDKLSVLAYLSGRSELRAQEIASHLGLNDRFVRRTINEFYNQNLLNISCLIDELSLGFQKLELLIVTKDLTADEKSAFESTVLKSPQVCFASRTSGSFDYYISLASKEMKDLKLWCQTLKELYPNLTSQGSSNYRGWRHFGAKYLFDGSIKLSTTTFTGFRNYALSNEAKLDTIDKTILNALAIKPTLSLTSLANMVELTIPGTKHRVTRLENAKIIRGKIHRIGNVEQVEKFSFLLKDAWPDNDTESQITDFLAQQRNVVPV